MLSNQINNDTRRKIHARINMVSNEIVKQMEWLTNNIDHVDFDKHYRNYNNLIVKRDACYDALEQMDGKYVTRSKYCLENETQIF